MKSADDLLHVSVGLAATQDTEGAKKPTTMRDCYGCMILFAGWVMEIAPNNESERLFYKNMDDLVARSKRARNRAIAERQ